MSAKILPALVAAVLVGTTALASAQTRSYWQDPYGYARGVAPGPAYQQGPFVGTFSEGMPYNTYTFRPGRYGEGELPGYGPNR
jgi:hypothetical protein